jgi:DNA-binding transcriptional LysR family regulator
MTAAGGLLNLTQAAVSQQIKRLEESFGSPLFERSRRGLQLTSAGERLFGRAQRLLALNDEIWAEMTTPLFEGEVRLGIPNDIVSTYLPACLKAFGRAYPKVRVSVITDNSLILLERMRAGEIDLTLTTEIGCGPDGESLLSERLEWVGARGGDAHRQRPLPVSIGCNHCTFQPPVLAALRRAEIPWRIVSDASNVTAQQATSEADLSVMVLLPSTVPPQLTLIGPQSGLPGLPMFSVNLYVPSANRSDIVRELARHIRETVMDRQRMAA